MKLIISFTVLVSMLVGLAYINSINAQTTEPTPTGTETGTATTGESQQPVEAAPEVPEETPEQNQGTEETTEINIQDTDEDRADNAADDDDAEDYTLWIVLAGIVIIALIAAVLMSASGRSSTEVSRTTTIAS